MKFKCWTEEDQEEDAEEIDAFCAAEAAVAYRECHALREPENTLRILVRGESKVLYRVEVRAHWGFRFYHDEIEVL